jgi:hypothetical protein
MKYHFNKLAAFTAFMKQWRTQIQGQPLTACFRPVATYPVLPDCFDDGVVLRTPSIDVSVCVDTSGGRARFGQFPMPVDRPYRLWGHDDRRWERWHDGRLIGQHLGTAAIGFITIDGTNHTYCYQVIIRVGGHRVILTDMQNMMRLSIEAAVPLNELGGL